MDSKYCKKFGDIFWLNSAGTRNLYKGGNEKDLKILENVDRRDDKDLADVGGGNGYFTNFIKKKYGFKKVFNVEINKSLCDVSSKRYNEIHTINDNILNLKVDKKLDVIIFFNSFFYIPDNEYLDLFKNLKKILNQNGVIFVNKHFSNREKNFGPIELIRIKLFNLKTYFLTDKFNFMTAIKFFFSKFEINRQRSEQLFIDALNNNNFEYSFDQKSNFFTIKNNIN